MTQRVYILRVSAFAQFAVALLLLVLAVLCILDGFDQHNPLTGLLVALAGVACGMLGAGAFRNGCRIVAARFHIFFGWRN